MIEVCGNTRHACLLTVPTVKTFPNSSRGGLENQIDDRAESAIRVHNMKSSTGMQLLSEFVEWARNSRSIATLCSNLRCKRRRVSRFVSAQKILRYAPVRRCGLTSRVKGKEGKLLGCLALQHCQQKSTSIRDERWIIAFRIDRSLETAWMDIAPDAIKLEHRNRRLIGRKLSTSRRTDFKLDVPFRF